MNRRDLLKGGALLGSLPLVGVVEAASAPDLPIERFNYISKATNHVQLQCASGYPDNKLDGKAKYWNIKIDKLEMMNKGISDYHLEALNQHYAEYLESRGWQVIDLEVFKGSSEYISRFVRGVVHMDGEQEWGRRVSEAIKYTNKQEEGFRKRHSLLSLYREYDDRWPNGYEWEEYPQDLIMHTYYLGQRFKHDYWDEGQDRFLHIT